MNEPRMTGSGPVVPRGLAERARDISDGRLEPAVPRDAATVILLRQDASAGEGGGVEAFLLRRTAELEFAPGAYVFPGGSVDARDADPGVGWAGPGRAVFAACPAWRPARARARVCAAVRETFEESGVLLAGASRDDLIRDSAALAADRHALLAGSASLTEVLARRGLVLRTDLLTPWARWITPEASPRRFDTWFFAAALPPGQDATAAPEGFGDHADPGESESGAWLRPASALEAARAGQMTLLPPTAVTLGELAGHPDVSAILARRQVITPRLPKLIAEAGSSSVVVVDPGPDDEAHLRRVHAAAVDGERRVATILLTHGHPDHSAGAARFAGLTGAPVRAADPAHRLGPEGLADGDVVTAAGCELRVVASPGHSADSVCLLLPADGALFTGDTVLGRGTTVIAGDGNLGDYLHSLAQLRDLAGAREVGLLLPGHGPMLTDPLATLDYYLAHRRERLDQVRSALAAGAKSPAEIVAMIYTDVDPSVWPAAEWSVRAQLDYLARANGQP